MPDPQYIDATDDPRLPALMAWRQRLIESGAVSRTSFKEAHLRLVLRSGRTDVAQIRAMLPPSVAEHAEDMARLLAEVDLPSPIRSPFTAASSDLSSHTRPSTIATPGGTAVACGPVSRCR